MLFFALGDLLLIAAFNCVFFFLAGPERTTAMWVAYGATHAVFLMFLATLLGKSKQQSDVAFHRVECTRVFVYYLIVLIVNTIAVLRGFSLLAVVLIQAGLFLVFGVGWLLVRAAKKDAGAQERVMERDLAWVRRNRQELDRLLHMPLSAQQKRWIRSVYDAICSSPIESCAALSDIEGSIERGVFGLQAQLNSEGLEGSCRSIVAMIETRNRGAR